ncbi:hypothetical protein ZWY2020_048851 [Hordeum vulgare]|nr:hypothetical protein ZWY2020_048851 [Hordeum vulgare]
MSLVRRAPRRRRVPPHAAPGRTWTGFMEAFAFKELRQYAELAVPSAMMVCLNTGTLMFTVPSGLYAAIRTSFMQRISKLVLLSEENPSCWKTLSPKLNSEALKAKLKSLKAKLFY